jgi:hypothetical protein
MEDSVMTKNYVHGQHGGHSPGHVCDTFLRAVDAFEAWEDGEPEPTVEHEVRYEPRLMSLTQACGLVWNCSDILPSLVVHQLEGCNLSFNRVTYAAAARAMRQQIAELLS